MNSTYTSSHTLWTTTKTWLSTARSATCFTTAQRATLEGIYCGKGGTHGFSSGTWITTAERNYLIDIWTQQMVENSD